MTKTAEARWRRLIEEQERSGLSVRKFAARRGISAGTMSWWRSELRRRSERLVPVAVVDEGGATQRSAPMASCFEIDLDDAITIRVRASFDEDDLRRILRALRC